MKQLMQQTFPRRSILLLLLTICTMTTTAQGVVTRNKPKPKQSTPTTCEVTFSCNVPSATMYLDGTNYGSPSGTRILKPGSYAIRLTADGYEDYRQSISVSSSNRSFSFTMTKKQVAQPITTTSTPSSRDRILSQIDRGMVYVEGGTFLMGATSEQGREASDDEKPTHNVTLSSFYISAHELTQAEWEAVMGSNPSHFKGSELPVESVSWDDCQEFINKLNSLTGKNYRLPTEAEWEYASRGGSKSLGFKYSGSNALGDVAWYSANCGSKTHPVKSKQSNELGLYDMSGNVWEWCQDWYGSYTSNSQTNPSGPVSDSHRVYRGGCWVCSAWRCRVSYRYYGTPSSRYFNRGLRLAR